MKKAIISLLSIAAFATVMTSCSQKDFQCNCTYVASSTGPSSGLPNRIESTNVKGRMKEQADVECKSLQGKYISEHFSGTCLIN